MIKVYWAPYWKDNKTDWNILYEDPIKQDNQTYSFLNPITTELLIQDNNIKYLSKNNVNVFLQGVFKDRDDYKYYIRYGMRFVFHCDESVNLNLTANHTDATLINYSKDINKKFDVTNIDLFLKTDKLKIKKDDILVNFHFDKEVDLVRFEMNDEIENNIDYPMYQKYKEKIMESVL